MLISHNRVSNTASGLPEIMHQTSVDALCFPLTAAARNIGSTEGPLRRATKSKRGSSETAY